jgi:hypothetical protein
MFWYERWASSPLVTVAKRRIVSQTCSSSAMDNSRWPLTATVGRSRIAAAYSSAIA